MLLLTEINEWMSDEIVVTPFAVGESAKREILAKPVQDGSASHQSIRTQVADNASNANKADGARRDDEAHPSNSNENYEADSDRESMVGHQNASVKGAEGQLSEKYVFTSKKRLLVERIPKASTYQALLPFQIISPFNFSRFITTFLNIVYI
jgi:hypothetical protein